MKLQEKAKRKTKTFHKTRNDERSLPIYRFTVIVERDEDGVYIARVPSLKGCHTCAETWEELPMRIAEAIEVCLEAMKEKNVPVIDDLPLVGAFQVEVKK